MSVKRKSDAGGKSENVKQLKVPKPKKEKDLETKKILQTNNPDVSNGKVKKIKTIIVFHSIECYYKAKLRLIPDIVVV